MSPRGHASRPGSARHDAAAAGDGARRADRGESGSATVEFALGLPSVVLVLAFALSAVVWVLDVESAQRGAGEAARVAIVDSDAAAVEVGTRASGEPGVTISRSGGFVTACIAVARAPWPAVSRCATARDRP
ncbi:MAG: pilus assembly protein [Demequinaceae bacterium]|nr:pilus assembly protein [Demequinaceae bacterium]